MAPQPVMDRAPVQPIFSANASAISDVAAIFWEISADGIILASSRGADFIASNSDTGFNGQAANILSTLFMGLELNLDLDRFEHTHLNQQDVWLASENGTSAPFSFNVTPILSSSGGICHFLAWATPRGSIGSEKLHLIQSAYQDSLTGLHNRRYLETHFDDYAKSAIESDEHLVLVVVDVNDFKEINDHYGHTFGDSVLEHIAQSLERAIPLGETVVRYGGDEFVILLHDTAPGEALDAILTDIRRETAKPIPNLDAHLTVKLSMGYSFFPDDGLSIRELVHKADIEMYKDKAETKGLPRRKKSTNSTWQKRLQSSDLDLSLAPHFQPIVDTGTLAIHGVEALCRWRKSDGSLSYPNEFIPVAENFDLISRIDRSMFTKVCAQVSELPEFRAGRLEIAVNLSATTLSTRGTADFYLKTLELLDLPPDQFCFELTETTTLLDDGYGRENLEAFYDANCAIALDDFGTGFSSLSLLKDLPVTRIKIDKSFVSGLHVSEKDRGIVSGILELCVSMGCLAIVEGIETSEQLKIIRDMGAKYCQGYYLGYPAPLAHTLMQASA